MQQKSPFLFAITVLTIFALPQIGIDLYLPALPSIQTALSTSQFYTQLSISFYILSMGATQLIYGPLSDRFGRKFVILSGIFVFFVGSVLIALTSKIEILLFGRFIQGLGMGAGFTVASAMLADTYAGIELAKMSTYSSMVYSMSPLLAPILGGVLTEYLNWQSNFLFMAISALLLMIAIVVFIRETNTNVGQGKLSLFELLAQYLKILGTLPFLLNTIILTLAFGVTIAFNMMGPFILQNGLSVSPSTYGLLLFILGGAYLVGTLLNSRLLNRVSINKLIGAGLGIMFIGSIGLLLAGFVGWFTVSSVILCSAVIIFGTGFVWPNAFANCLAEFSVNMGLVTALIGAIGFMGTSLLSAVLGQFKIQSELPLAYTYFFLTAASCVLFAVFIFLKKKKFTVIE